MNLCVSIEAHELARAIFEDFSHEDVRKLIEEICDCYADSGLDEAIIADRLRSIDGCYDEDSPMPTNEQLLETYKDLT